MSKLREDAIRDARPTLQERFRRLPEALLLTAGYYASRVRVLNGLIRRLD
jgi:hypothetical protein